MRSRRRCAPVRATNAHGSGSFQLKQPPLPQAADHWTKGIAILLRVAAQPARLPANERGHVQYLSRDFALATCGNWYSRKPPALGIPEAECLIVNQVGRLLVIPRTQELLGTFRGPTNSLARAEGLYRFSLFTRPPRPVRCNDFKDAA